MDREYSFKLPKRPMRKPHAKEKIKYECRSEPLMNTYSYNIKEFEESSVTDISSKDIENTINHFQSLDGILEYFMKWITIKTESCIKLHEGNTKQLMEEIENGLEQEVLQQRLHLLKDSEEIFKYYVGTIKNSLNELSTLPLGKATVKGKLLINYFINECKMFLCNYFLYAFKKKILTKISHNQVTVILSNPEYCTSTQIPYYLFREYSERGKILSCHPNELSAACEKLQFDRQVGQNCDKLSCEIELAENVHFSTAENLFSKPDLIFHCSCIIIDKANYRNVETDLLFAQIRKLLKQRKNLKLVIMATSEEPSIFCSYFKSFTNGVVLLPDISFSRTIVWKEGHIQIKEDYVNTVVKTVTAIHALKEKGDILAFLPSSQAILKSCKALHHMLKSLGFESLDIYTLHENVHAKNTLKLLIMNKSLKRRIIFTTSYAESSLYFPTVKFIVDSGITIKRCYCLKQKAFNTLTCFISKESASRRAACCGMNKNGICFRLYSKENYNNFETRTVPEVFNLEPCQLVLTLLRLKPTNLEDIELIESLDKKELSKALNELYQLGAVRDFVLTPLGESIVHLPFQAAYSKLLVLGRQRGFSFLTAILLAILLLNNPLYMCKKGNESLENCDKESFVITDPIGDTVTTYKIYTHWLSLETAAEKEKWCSEFNIIETKINEIHFNVNKICKVVKIPVKNAECFENTTNNDLIQELLFECLINNLCVFTGNLHCGYFSLFNKKLVFLHPSSSLFSTDSTLPKFVVYGKVHSSTCDYMVNVTVVPENMVSDAIKCGKLNIDFEYIQNLQLVSLTVKSLGTKQINYLLGSRDQKLCAVQDAIKTAIKSDLVVVDLNSDKGTVVLYTLPQHIKEAEAVLHNYLHDSLNLVKNEEEVIPLKIANNHNVHILWGQGATIKQYPAKQNSKKHLEKVLERKISKNILDDLTKYSINLTWRRRKCKGDGIISFLPTDFPIARSKLAMTCININGMYADIQMSKINKNGLYISGLGPAPMIDDIKDAIEKRLPDNVHIEELCLFFDKKSENENCDIEEIENFFRKFCSNFISPERVTLFVPKPKISATVVEAYLDFDNLQDHLLIKSKLNGARIFNMEVTAKSVFCSVLFYPTSVIEVLLDRINNTLQSLKERIYNLNQNEREEDIFHCDISALQNNTSRIKLVTSDFNIMDLLKVVLNKLLEGDTLNSKHISHLHRLFCHGGRLWLSQLQKETQSYIVSDYRTHSLCIYGSLEACQKVRNRIDEYLKNTDNEVVKCVDLSFSKKSFSLLKVIIEKYGTDCKLESFAKRWALMSAQLDVRHCKLVMHGAPDDILKAEEHLEQLAASSSSSLEQITFTVENEELCPVCMCSTSTGLTYRLECCGHVYCYACIQLLISEALIPLQCCALNCEEKLTLQDIRTVLENDTELISRILNASLKVYAQNNKNIAYCSTPDCPMIYNKDYLKGTSIWNCPVCHNDFCVMCGLLDHQGYSCEMYREMKEDPDYPVKIWMKSDPSLRKQCPNCSSAIEKNGGCSHIHCINCNSHICWNCLQLYPSTQGVYDHVPYCSQNRA